YAGYVVGYATSPIGIFLGGVLAVGLIWVIVRPSGRSGGQGGGPRRNARRVGAAGVATVIVAAGAVAQAPVPTLAYFSDTGAVASGSLSTLAMVSQPQPQCDNVNGLLVL